MTTWQPCDHCPDPKFCEWMPSADFCAMLAESAAADEAHMQARLEYLRTHCLGRVHGRPCVREKGHDGSCVTCLGELSDPSIALTPEGLALGRWGMHFHDRDASDRVFTFEP